MHNSVSKIPDLRFLSSGRHPYVHVVRMHSHQAHIGEYKGTTEEHIVNKVQLWDAIILLLKEYNTFMVVR